MYVHFGFFITIIFTVVSIAARGYVGSVIRLPNSGLANDIKLDKDIEKMNKWKILIKTITNIDNKIENIENKIVGSKKPKNCDEHFKMGKNISGESVIYPYAFSPVSNFVFAYCEYILDGEYEGGWTVIQRRDNNVSKRENFKRNWSNYKTGFGDSTEEYWLGLNAIHALTNSEPMQLQIILEDWENKREVVNYKKFRIEDERNKYQLRLSGFNGNIRDSMADHNEMFFTTGDADNDKSSGVNCAKYYEGGWWYESCFETHLNGLPNGAGTKEPNGIWWYGFNPSSTYHSLRTVIMMIKPFDCK